MVPVSLWTGWIHSVTYVSVLSLWALIASHWSAWEAARVEVMQQKADEQDIAQDVTDRIVEQTEISSTTSTVTTEIAQEDSEE